MGERYTEMLASFKLANALIQEDDENVPPPSTRQAREGEEDEDYGPPQDRRGRGRTEERIC
jgi:hypothetical protein